MERKQIIDKVVKLMALSENNSNSAEAKAAKNMAAKLMAKHDISVIEAKEKPQFGENQRMLARKNHKKEDTILFNCIAEFNGVCLLTHKGNKFFKASYIFVGRAQDIEGSDYMIDVVLQQREYAWKKYLKANKKRLEGTTQGKERGLWMYGFGFGVRAKLEELTRMKNQKVQEYGLVPVSLKDQALAEYQKDHQIKDSKSKITRYNPAGFNSGKDVHIHKGVSKQTSTKQIG